MTNEQIAKLLDKLAARVSKLETASGINHPQKSVTVFSAGSANSVGSAGSYGSYRF